MVPLGDQTGKYSLPVLKRTDKERPGCKAGLLRLSGFDNRCGNETPTRPHKPQLGTRESLDTALLRKEGAGPPRERIRPKPRTHTEKESSTVQTYTHIRTNKRTGGEGDGLEPSALVAAHGTLTGTHNLKPLLQLRSQKMPDEVDRTYLSLAFTAVSKNT